MLYDSFNGEIFRLFYQGYKLLYKKKLIVHV